MIPNNVVIPIILTSYGFVPLFTMPSHEIVLYTRADCCLCHDAHALLLRAGLSPRLVDIDGDPKLRERFTTCVPVVEIDGKIRFRGRVNEVLLRRILHSPAKS